MIKILKINIGKRWENLKHERCFILVEPVNHTRGWEGLSLPSHVSRYYWLSWDEPGEEGSIWKVLVVGWIMTEFPWKWVRRRCSGSGSIYPTPSRTSQARVRTNRLKYSNVNFVPTILPYMASLSHKNLPVLWAACSDGSYRRWRRWCHRRVKMKLWIEI